MLFGVYKGQIGDWRWYLKAANGKIVADSGEGYKDKRDCLAGITLVKGCVDAVVIDLEEGRALMA